HHTVDPEALWQWGEQLGWDVALSWAEAQSDGSYDVLLRRNNHGVPLFPRRQRPRRRLTNNPMRKQAARRLTAELRRYLDQRLPEYMAPTAFVVLESLPLTPNGKLDRRALPAPDQLRPELANVYVAPQSPAEQLVAAIWSDVLGIERIGAHDDFFKLGGHSLLATQVISRVRNTFQVELPLRDLFEAPTIAGLAAKAQHARQVLRGLEMPPMQPVPRFAELPLSFAQQRLWFLNELEPGVPAYNIPLAVRLTGKLDAAALEASLQEVVRRHEALRTTFTTVEGRALQ